MKQLPIWQRLIITVLGLLLPFIIVSSSWKMQPLLLWLFIVNVIAGALNYFGMGYKGVNGITSVFVHLVATGLVISQYLDFSK